MTAMAGIMMIVVRVTYFVRNDVIPACAGVTAMAGIMTIVVRVAYLARNEVIPAKAGVTAMAGIMTIVVGVTHLARNDVIPAKAGIHCGRILELEIRKPIHSDFLPLSIFNMSEFPTIFSVSQSIQHKLKF